MRDEAPLVGRAEELAFVCDEVRARGGVVVGGAAGVGKTRLARELVTALAGWHVEWATVTRAVAEVPLGGLEDLDLPEVVHGHGQAGMLAGVRRVIADRAAGRAVLLVVDDAHLLDELSAGVVRRLVESGSVAVLLTVRTGEPAPAGVMALYKAGQLPRLELQPLGRPEFTQLLAGRLGGPVETGTVDRLWSYTAGNALFVRELISDALAGGALAQQHGQWVWAPDGRVGPRLAELVAERMGRLRGARQQLAELLAVAEPLSVGVVEQLVEGLDLVEEERRGLIVVEEFGRRALVRLAHPLFGEAIRAQMPVLARRRWQRLLADSVEAVGARRGGDLLRVAVWRVESATATDAQMLVGAAERARATFDPKLAVRLAEGSLQIQPSFQAALVRGGSLSDLGRYDAAAQVLDPLVGTEPDDTGRQALARERSWAQLHLPGGLPAAERILATVESIDGDPLHRLLARGDLALLLTYAGRFGEALAVGRPLVAPGMDARVRLRALPSVGASLVLAGETDQVLTLCTDLEPVVSRMLPGLPQANGWLWQMRTNVLILSGRVREAEELLEPPLVEGAEPLLGDGDLAYGRTKLGYVLLLAGRPRSAATELAAAAAVLRTNDPNGCLGWCLSLAAQAHVLLGQAEVADRLATEAAGQQSNELVVFDGDAARARAWVVAAAGDRTRAINALRRIADSEHDRGVQVFAMQALHDALRLGAWETADDLAALAATLDGPGPSATARYATAIGSHDPEVLCAAAQDLAEVGQFWMACEAATLAATWWSQAGHRARALAAHGQVTSWASGEILLSPSQPTVATVSVGLTRREAEVVALTSRGLTNAAIAERLVLSVRTVESHLYSAYAKLGVADRSELVALLGPGAVPADDRGTSL